MLHNGAQVSLGAGVFFQQIRQAARPPLRRDGADLLQVSTGQPVPRLAAWSLGVGIMATVGANLAHGVGHGPVGALVSAWPALALVGSFELLMMLIRTGRGARAGPWR